jgi:transcriptional regulator with XRE-family HTH domain
VCPAWRLLLEINSQPSSPSNNTHVATGIGEQLSAARSARGIELEEVEERTKIRKRYLRAMEEERWELLPGAAYARAFLRTYAEFLALDGEALVEEYRRSHDSREVESDAEPVRQIAMAAPPRLARPRRRRPPAPAADDRSPSTRNRRLAVLEASGDAAGVEAVP